MSLFDFTSLFSMTDEQAMWRVQTEDDSQAFAQLLQRWQEPIRRLCARMVGNEHKAEDLAQEAFSRVYLKRKDYQASSKFSTWLWRIAINLCHDELRKVKRRRETALPEFESAEDPASSAGEWAHPEPAPDESARRGEDRELVRQALLRLGDPLRAVVVMRHYENLKFREIAEVLGVPEGTVKSRMAEALTQLNGILSRRMKEEPGFWLFPNPKAKNSQRLPL